MVRKCVIILVVIGYIMLLTVFVLVVRSGFIELLARIAHYGRLSSIKANGPRSQANGEDSDAHSVHLASTLLRLMDASGGKDKLIRSSRKSVAIRKFVYAPSSANSSLKQKHKTKNL